MFSSGVMHSKELCWCAIRNADNTQTVQWNLIRSSGLCRRVQIDGGFY